MTRNNQSINILVGQTLKKLNKPKINEVEFLVNKILKESKQTEQLGLSLLKKAGVDNPEAIIKVFAQKDESKNQKNIPIMAFIFANWEEKDENNIANVLNEFNDLETKNRVKSIQIAGSDLKIGNKPFKDFINFAGFIHAEKNKYADKSSDASVDISELEPMEKPLWSGNGIDVYEAHDVGKCIRYTQGGLTGKGYSFCIGQPGSGMFHSYRASKDSTFFYVIDKNHMKENPDGTLDMSDPLHIVVFDRTKYGLECTDADNHCPAELAAPYGKDFDKYERYLESKGVPVDDLINKPKTPEEIEEQRILGKQNNSLEWFKNLSFDYKSKYIGRGHPLTDEQFDYLIGRED